MWPPIPCCAEAADWSWKPDCPMAEAFLFIVCLFVYVKRGRMWGVLSMYEGGWGGGSVVCAYVCLVDGRPLGANSYGRSTASPTPAPPSPHTPRTHKHDTHQRGKLSTALRALAA